MNEEQLLSRTTFAELFSKSELDRIDTYNKLLIQAKKLNLEKEFKDTYKTYDKLLGAKIGLSDYELPYCKYDIKNYNFGHFTCNVQGMEDSKAKYKFSYFPVIPVEKYINEASGKEKIKIIWYKDETWKEKIVDKSQLSISNKLLLLSDDGLNVNSENVRYYINYFSEVMNLNEIKTLNSVSHLGWKVNDFLPYDKNGIFDGQEEFCNLFNAVSSKGNKDKWQACIDSLTTNKYMKLIMATTLASPLLEKLNVMPFIVNVWSSLSGNGKTLSCMVAMSLWGNPAIGALTLSSNSTQNYYAKIAGFMNNITCYFDEFQIVKNEKSFNADGLIMDLCNGTEKGRLNKNSQARVVETWRNNFLFTNNDRLIKENGGEQLYNRVIELEICEKLINDGMDIANIIHNNYGFGGKEYIKYIQEIGFDAIFKRFKELNDEILAKSNSTTKQSSIFASLLLADELGNKCIFNENCYKLTVDDILEYINDKNEIKTSVKAYQYIVSVIASNPRKFDASSFNEYWGRKDDFVCIINHQILMRELAKGGFDFNTVKKEWSQMGYLKLNSQGRYIHSASVEGQKGIYVYLNL